MDRFYQAIAKYGVPRKIVANIANNDIRVIQGKTELVSFKDSSNSKKEDWKQMQPNKELPITGEKARGHVIEIPNNTDSNLFLSGAALQLIVQMDEIKRNLKTNTVLPTIKLK